MSYCCAYVSEDKVDTCSVCKATVDRGKGIYNIKGCIICEERVCDKCSKVCEYCVHCRKDESWSHKCCLKCLDKIEILKCENCGEEYCIDGIHRKPRYMNLCRNCGWSGGIMGELCEEIDDLEEEVVSLKAEIDKLKQENLHLCYAYGSKGYQEAKADFDLHREI